MMDGDLLLLASTAKKLEPIFYGPSTNERLKHDQEREKGSANNLSVFKTFFLLAIATKEKKVFASGGKKRAQVTYILTLFGAKMRKKFFFRQRQQSDDGKILQIGDTFSSFHLSSSISTSHNTSSEKSK